MSAGRLTQIPCSANLAYFRAMGGRNVLGRATPERLSTFSDGVFAVLITVLVHRPPVAPEIEGLTVHNLITIVSWQLRF